METYYAQTTHDLERGYQEHVPNVNINKAMQNGNCPQAGRTFEKGPRRNRPGTVKKPRVPRGEKPPQREFKYVQEMVSLLATPFERVFKLDENQTTFISPALMQGVTVGKMEEGGEDWESSWCSIDIWKDTEDPQNALVKRTKGECERVIANFGPDAEFHPNQLLTAFALPSDGLCNSRVPIELCPYLETLQPLHDDGILKMRPLDFVRWRLIEKFSRKKKRVWPKPVKSAVRNLRLGSPKTRDYLMRYAMRLGNLDSDEWEAFMDEYRRKNSTNQQDEN
ncbi:unnamed protein product [Clonostachys rosea]|uniref:Uncharacterized protein n=1 Tax=Bionectria ochroleuca TaxID=29856 RepID=A0ABY6UUF9_BIOOC|nr:unnamed protein product [Clonostachys rosea]